MKKVILSFATFVMICFTSCSESKIENDISNDDSSIARNAQVEGIDVESIHINNGIESCEMNLLVFNSWDDYHKMIEVLDNQIDLELDAFDTSIGAAQLSDDDYNAKCEALGFDEDNVLRRFEDELGFCSLRKKIENEENAWLDQQGPGDLNMNLDPDNHFIDDETERTLLNEQVQVGIRDKRGEIVIYHLNDDEGNYVEIYNMDEVALQQVTTGQIVQGNPNVVNVVVRPENQVENCKNNVTEKAFHSVGDQALKRTSKVRREVEAFRRDSKIKAKTKGYKRKNGKWKGTRTEINVGFFGQIPYTYGFAYNTCNGAEKTIRKEKPKRRRHVRTKYTIPRYDGLLPQLQYWSIKNNKIYSYHKRGGVEVNVDFYDMP